MAALADRHYSRRTVGSRQFMYSGRKLVIRDAAGTMLFGWMWPQTELRMDHQDGFFCSIFRNESPRRSSDIILECEKLAIAKWGPNRMYTYVKPSAIKSVNPGYCFKCAGWQFAGLSSKRSQPSSHQQSPVFASKSRRFARRPNGSPVFDLGGFYLPYPCMLLITLHL